MSAVDIRTGELVGADTWLRRVERMARDVERIATAQEAVDVIDYAEAARVFARESKLGDAAVNHATVVKLRAEIRLANVIDQGQAAGAIATPGGDRQTNVRSADIAPTTLADLGVKRQRLAEARRIRDAYTDSDVITAGVEATEEARELSRRRMLKEARQDGASVAAEPGPVPEGTYRVIIADPPWRYGNTATRGAAEDHYGTLTIGQLVGDDPTPDGTNLAEQVLACTAEDAHLYLWTTNGFLREAFSVVDAWGFTYKTCLTWVKPQMGMGNYFRSSTEHVLFGMRGNLPTRERNIVNWFEAPRGRHSSKPQQIYDLVERASPGPYLEMFSRARRLSEHDWNYWGDQS